MQRREVEELYRRYGSLVQRRARAIMRHEEEAQDMMQEVFVRVIRNLDAFRREASPTTWLYRITTNLCLNRLRDRKRQRDKLAREGVALATPSRSDSAQDARIAVLRLLERMPTKLAEPALYHYVDGLSQHEVGRLLGIPRRTVTHRIKKFDALAEQHLAVIATGSGQ